MPIEERVEEIAAATAEQSQATAEIMREATTFADSSDAISCSMQSTAEQIVSLREAGEALVSLVHQFETSRATPR